MKKKFTVKLLILMFVFAGFLITGCFEEPFIAPVKQPYTSVRVGHFAYNLSQIDVYVDGVLRSTLNKNEIQNVNFDLASGRRIFIVIEGADTVFDASLRINSYDESSILYTGFNEPGVDSLHTFGAIQLLDGVVYLFETPAAGFTRIIYSNLASPTPTENSKRYRVALSTDVSRDTTEALDFNKSTTVDMKTGEYLVSVVFDVPVGDPVSVLDSMMTFSEGMREYVFITGDPSSPVIVRV